MSDERGGHGRLFVGALRELIEKRRSSGDVDVVLMALEAASAAQAVGMSAEDIAAAFSSEWTDAR
jgi:hypothetical protein